MSPRELGRNARLMLQLLRAEGPLALRDRVLDRLAEARRRRSFRLLAPGEEPGKPTGVAVVNVLSAPPAMRLGGVEAQLLSRLEEEARLRGVALLYPWGGRWRLEVAAEGVRWAVGLDGSGPGEAGVDGAPQVRGVGAAIRQALRRVGARAVHVETALGLPPGELAELPVESLLLSVHDFALFCRRPHLLEEPMRRFCGYCRDEGRCRRCLESDGFLRGTPVEDHRHATTSLLEASRVTIFPSAFLRNTHRELFPDREGDWRVIHPGVLQSTGQTRSAGVHRRPRIALIGGGDAHKGAVRAAELVSLSRRQGKPLEWWSFGGGDRVGLRRLRQAGARIRGYYRWGQLTRLLNRHGIAVAVLLPTVPESFSLAFSECLLSGVPVVASRLGALGDRAREAGETVIDPDADPAILLAAVEAALERPRRGAIPRVPMATDAARAHLAVYRDLGLVE